MKLLESSVNTQIRSQNDHPSLKIPHEIHANSRVPVRVCDVEGGAVCSKNSTFGYFDGVPHLRFFIMLLPIMTPDYKTYILTTKLGQVRTFLPVYFCEYCF